VIERIVAPLGFRVRRNVTLGGRATSGRLSGADDQPARSIPTSIARSVRSSSQSISRPADDFGQRPAYRSRREQKAWDDSWVS